MNCPGLEK
jgi:hypothetical protein